MSFSLRDQSNRLHAVTFPRSDLTVLMVADEAGARELGPWCVAVEDRLGSATNIYGVAELSSVPWFMRGSVRKRIAREYAFPVLLDWDGLVRSQLAFQPRTANLYVLATNGMVIAKWEGPAQAGKLDQLTSCLKSNRFRSSSLHIDPERAASSLRGQR